GPGEPLARQPRCGSLVHDGHNPHPAARGLAGDVRPSRGLQARADRLLLSEPCSQRTPSPMTLWRPRLFARLCPLLSTSLLTRFSDALAVCPRWAAFDAGTAADPEWSRASRVRRAWMHSPRWPPWPDSKLCCWPEAARATDPRPTRAAP